MSLLFKSFPKVIAVMALLFIFSICGFVYPLTTDGDQEETPDKTFKIIKEYPRTKIKSQGRTGTCWSFCTISLLESELIRMGKGEYELSEMFPVYHSYIERAVIYLRTQGKNNFEQGGIDNDVLWTIRQYGILRDSDYDGMWPGEEYLNHSELEGTLQGYLQALTKSGPSKKWRKGFVGVLNGYMQAPPEKIAVDGREITPKQFADEVLGINPDDYIGITSFLHMPLYKQSELYLPDNWMHHSDFYNVSLDEFVEIMNHALETGYTISIGADVSEKSWYTRKGYAVWNEDKVVTPEEREEMWDNWETTDDHGMHTVGLAEDEDGKIFYYTKNSWGDKAGPYEGYIYISENYIRAKVNAITIHKEALAAEMRDKLGIN